MATPGRITALALSFVLPAVLGFAPQAPATAQSAALKIVVLKGEDAVNIIQQKTAVAPLVEVRDRNNLPVPGAIVTFTVGGGQGATFGGVSTLTVTTNAAGQAAAAGFAPTAAGAVQINATAVFQGQTAIATITQTNVMTAAEAAGAAGGSASGGGAGASGGGTSGATAGAAGGVGGGLGTGAIVGIVGGVVGGGAVIAKAAGGDGDSSTTGTAPSNPTSTTPPPTTTTTAPTTTTTSIPATTVPSSATGTYNGIAYTDNFTFDPIGGQGGFTCGITANWNLTARLSLTSSGSNVGGTGTLDGVQTVPSHTCSQAIPGISFEATPFTVTGPISGTASSITFRQDLSQTIPIDGSSSLVITGAITFTGSLSGGVINGTVTINYGINFPGTPGVGGGFRGTGSGSFPLTLR